MTYASGEGKAQKGKLGFTTEEIMAGELTGDELWSEAVEGTLIKSCLPWTNSAPLVKIQTSHIVEQMD